ncbi:STM3941 family protein [Methylocystis bryophila]|uniref:PH domain-containing protein n=1 Tax=Methylocystis bryophila TaxID=655015 RepID=A0A1W6MYR1_9HYPH|nr:STM3941 family protein [Methylocystis bryophila]ARN82715.1 hypothetical protein B1812_18285 [Methylocystis bryophila]BDV38947.1 hypothetical protein DSM21852_22000 [Methylocystis bryophila]
MVHNPPSDAPIALTTEVYRQSLLKVIGLGLGSLAFVVIGVSMLGDPTVEENWTAWAVIAFFGFCGLVALALAIRPQTLTLDRNGFTVAGGFVPKPHHTRWSDVQGFFVYSPQFGVKMIGFNYAPGKAPQSVLVKISRCLGPEAGIAGGWELSPGDLVEKLNDYQRRALGA